MSLVSSEFCTGCAACVNVCPKSAIHMQSDCEGFLQPIINKEFCVNCGLCENVCPLPILDRLCPVQIDKNPVCGITTNTKIWRESSSGGAFTEICEAVRCRNPIVFGACFKEDLSVYHRYVTSVDEISPFRKSKYVQSDVGFTFRQCRDFLESGRYVLYSGTPCQIAGLRSYLGHDSPNLLCVEFICHGVGSPLVFKKSIKAVAAQKNEVLLRYEFRTKESGLGDDTYCSLYTFKTGRSMSVVRDIYNKLFLNQLCLRKSCMENCRFRNSRRFADITMGDARGEETIYADKGNKNWSVIIANTQKGEDVMRMLGKSMDVRPYPIALLAKTNPLYFRTTRGNPMRDNFFRDFRKGISVWRLAHKYAPDCCGSRFESSVAGALRNLLCVTGLLPIVQKLRQYLREARIH